jgi:FlaA1/EpsC-like NDP-sugar epimerase
MIRLSGADENRIRIEYSGLRPGEKLYEELLADSESTLPTPHPKLYIARARAPNAEEIQACMQWLESTGEMGEGEVKAKLAGWIPEYRPQSAAN